MVFVLLLIVIGYLVGSVPFGKIIARKHGIDIQKKGSGNIGFANVRRVLGWKAGIATLIGDILKGAVPTYLTLAITGNELVAFYVGTCAILGHIFPIWLGFKGGKGIATGLGVVAVVSPFAAITGVTTYLLSLYAGSSSSKASLLGLFITACTAILLEPSNWWQFGIFILIALWTLRKNIAGTVPQYDI